MKFFGKIVVAGLFVLAFSPLAFAQGLNVCSGAVSGVVNSDNGNVGTTYFDSHPGPDGVADLSLVGKTPGFAPGDIRYAACTETDLDGRVSVGEFVNERYVFRIKGFAWNDNLGFISFACEGGQNRSGSNLGAGAACGPFDYGVYLAPPSGGVSEVFGYAYNATFGWLKFGGDCAYGPVFADANGDVSGYACSESNVPVKMTGMNLQYVPPNEVSDYYMDGEGGDDLFLDEVFGDFEDNEGDLGEIGDFLPDAGNGAELALEDVDSEWCDGRAGVCVEVLPNPFGLRADADIAGERSLKVADGKEAYELHLFLRDDDLNALLPNDYENFDDFLDSIELVWRDTVKLDQTGGSVGNTLDEIANPFERRVGGVNGKPLSFEDFEDRGGGHYVAELTSYAPTTGGNISMTYTEPPFAVSNEHFIYGVDASVPEEKNELVLRSVQHGELRLLGGESYFEQQPVFANGKVDLHFDFRPAVDVNVLFANAYEDAISAIRNIPVNLKVGLGSYGQLPDDAVNRTSVRFDLDLDDEVEDRGFDGCNGNDFDFYFLNSFNPLEEDEENVERQRLEVRYKNFFIAHPQGEWDLRAKAALREENDSCSVLKAPSLYSTVSVPIEGRTVKYYSNKLPKVDAAVKNPAVVVKGNIQAQTVTSVSADRPVVSAGSVNDSTFKNIFKSNVGRYFDPPEVSKYRGVCELTGLSEEDVLRGGCQGQYLEIGEERALYFHGQDVRLLLGEEDFVDGDKVVLISDAGNIFVDADLHDRDDEFLLTLLSMRDRDRFDTTGHVYIAGAGEERRAVKNVQATIVADGSLFSYDGSLESIDENNGEPIFDSLASRLKVLGDQLLIEGSVYSDNTIGGGDIDSVGGKDYLLLGGGRVIWSPFSVEDRLRAQAYDMNYLRLFQLELELADNGFPVDQNCGRGLSFEDLEMIREGEVVCGERGECDPEQGGANACNGINPYDRYLGVRGQSDDGDLIIPRELGRLSLGLDNGLSVEAGGRPADPNAPRWLQKKDYEPVFVFFREGYDKSFLFELR